MGELGSPIPLPVLPSVELPSPYNPPSPCFTCGDGSDRLRLLELDIVIHRIPLDTYRPDLTGDLLTIEGLPKKGDSRLIWRKYGVFSARV